MKMQGVAEAARGVWMQAETRYGVAPLYKG